MDKSENGTIFIAQKQKRAQSVHRRHHVTAEVMLARERWVNEATNETVREEADIALDYAASRCWDGEERKLDSYNRFKSALARLQML